MARATATNLRGMRRVRARMSMRSRVAKVKTTAPMTRQPAISTAVPRPLPMQRPA
jgi:hypothetical protein